MTSEEIEKLKKQIEIEKEKVEEADKLKDLNKELLRLQHTKAAKFADVAKDLPKMLMSVLSGLVKFTGKTVEALNKMDEKVVAAQKKENESKNKEGKQEEPLGDLIRDM